MRFRNGAYGDIDLSGTIKRFFLVLVIFIVVFALFTFLFCILREADIGSVIAANAAIDEYQALTVEERIKINPLLQKIGSDLAVYCIPEESEITESVSSEESEIAETITLEELVMKTREYARVPDKWTITWMRFWFPAMFIFIGFIYIVVFIYSYLNDRDTDHYLADIPWNCVQIYFYIPALLFLSPGLIASACYLIAAKKKAKDLANLEPRVSTLPTGLVVTTEMVESFSKFYSQRGISQRYERRLSECRESLKGNIDLLKRYGEQIKRQQILVADNKAELQYMEEHAPSERDGVLDISKKFQILQNIRGIANLNIIKGKVMEIVVFVRVEYQNKLFDFGDWQLSFSDEGYTAKVLRRGTRASWRISSYPDYSYSDGGFCFGNRSDEIMNFVRNWDYVEAIALAVDCLHSVNNESHRQRIPEAFMEIISPKSSQQSEQPLESRQTAAPFSKKKKKKRRKKGRTR